MTHLPSPQYEVWR